MAISPRLRQIMFFTRLRAAGNFNPKCALEKGRCKGKYTQTSAKALGKTEFANTNKKSPNYSKMLSQAQKNFNKGSGASFDRKAATKALGDAKGTGNKVSIKSSVDSSGVRKTTARVRGEKDVRKTTTETKSQRLRQDLREQKKKDNFKLQGKKEVAKKVAELAKTNKSLIPTAEKRAKESMPTSKQKKQYGAAKSRIKKAEKAEATAKASKPKKVKKLTQKEAIVKRG